MHVRTIFLLLCFSAIVIPTYAQHQQRQLFAYNIGICAITSGIGSIINKPKSVNWKNAFVRGLWQGAAGGAVTYSSKKTIYLVNKKQNIFYLLPSKILQAAGASIIENAASYNPFLENWTIDYGPVRIDFGARKRTKVRFLPETIYATIGAARYGRFDLSRSALSGTLVFITPSVRQNWGYSFGRAIVYTNSSNATTNKNRLLAHEILHTYQYKDYQFFNSWLKPLGTKLSSTNPGKVFKNYVYFDVPYIYPFYQASGHYRDPHYFRNFYEFEAESFSTNRKVFR